MDDDDVKSGDVGGKPSAASRSVETRFGQLVLLAARHPRYRELPVGDLQAVLLAPVLANCVAAGDLPGEGGGPGAAIWCSVSPEVSARIAAESDRGVFPIRLERGEWRGGTETWLLDVIAPNPRVGTAVFSTFSRNVDRPFRMHPQASRSIDPDVIRRIVEAAGAARSSGS